MRRFQYTRWVIGRLRAKKDSFLFVSPAFCDSLKYLCWHYLGWRWWDKKHKASEFKPPGTLTSLSFPLWNRKATRPLLGRLPRAWPFQMCWACCYGLSSLTRVRSSQDVVWRRDSYQAITPQLNLLGQRPSHSCSPKLWHGLLFLVVHCLQK